MNLSIMVKNNKGKVCNMYQDEYKRWLAADLEDADLKPELAKIEGNDDEIKDRFAVALKFGTAGLRGVLGGIFDAATAESTYILYGGSMNEKNAFSLLSMKGVDGGLIGGASLDAEKFISIIKAYDNTERKI